MSKQSEFSDDYYREKFPELAGFGVGPFGEDAEIYGDSIAEVIEAMTQTTMRSSKIDALHELYILLSYNDADLDKATWALIALDPTIDIEELEPGWGFYPSLRAFWADVLRYIEADLAKPVLSPENS